MNLVRHCEIALALVLISISGVLQLSPFCIHCWNYAECSFYHLGSQIQAASSYLDLVTSLRQAFVSGRVSHRGFCSFHEDKINWP
jgi:hypothetical protein